LKKYEGSLILVSHDRYFISRLANKIWEIEDLKIREFKGSYAEWEDWKERRAKAEAEQRKTLTVPVAAAAVPVAEKKPQPEKQNDSKKEIQKLKTRFKTIEEKLAQLAEKKSLFENKLAEPEIYNNKTKFQETETGYKQALKEWTAVNEEYETLFEQIMSLEG
jgi:ATP-binding cassette subfamily F protein 3